MHTQTESFPQALQGKSLEELTGLQLTLGLVPVAYLSCYYCQSPISVQQPGLEPLSEIGSVWANRVSRLPVAESAETQTLQLRCLPAN